MHLPLESTEVNIYAVMQFCYEKYSCVHKREEIDKKKRKKKVWYLSAGCLIQVSLRDGESLELYNFSNVASQSHMRINSIELVIK